MNSIIISAIGLDRPGIVSELTGIINNHGGNIEESRMSKLGMDFAVIMLFSLNKFLIFRQNIPISSHKNHSYKTTKQYFCN